MQWKKFLLHGIIAGILSAVACIIYMRIYEKTFELNYAEVLHTSFIIATNILACLLMTVAYKLLYKKQCLIGWLNILIVVLTFASILIPIGYTLPLDIQEPEMFPGLAIPMLFFPALSFFTLTPFFKYRIH